MSDLSKLRIDRDSEGKESSSRVRMIVIVLVAIAALVTGYFLYTGPLKPATEVKVTTVNAVHPAQASSVLNASGYVVAQRQADVASKATGKLELLVVEEGTVMKKEQMIGKLESKDVEAALAQAKADLQVAFASLST